jgi:superfamily I DNA/RNA helicase
MGIPYQSADDGLLLDEPAIDELLDGLPEAVLPAIWLARQAGGGQLPAVLAAWAVPHRTAAQLRDAVRESRKRRRELRRDDAGLVLATAHGTKGLEFDHVCCIGMDDGTFPSRRTLDESDDPVRALEEERRLAYVAWTRARRSLLLVYDPAAPSDFMREAFSDQELSPLSR